MDIFLPIYLPFTNPSASPMQPNFTASFGLARLRLCVYSSPFLCLSKKTLKAMPLRSFHKTPCGNRQSVDSNGVRSAYSLTIVKGYLVDFHLANSNIKEDRSEGFMGNPRTNGFLFSSICKTILFESVQAYYKIAKLYAPPGMLP